MEPKLKVTYKEAVKVYLQFRKQVEDVHYWLKEKFELPDSGASIGIEYVETGEIIISSHCCPLVMQMEEHGCLDNNTLTCTVKEKYPAPGDEGMQMRLSYPGTFISNAERLAFILKFFDCTRISEIMITIDAETAHQRSHQ